ncbi:glycerol-3-phosphate 1-O-acyltransferase PlsY [Tissierella creatinophila]|uniref:Glycerol-3-phosphate acyltransferase n=1 Tax=Tissierella creatinophila DSM 6911 TaxID=1123403 RepID=A0A1U7M325_TISCR|nr:glycerol-3-phosphate 1-O-acyltransferase PlsY [Tissierella creatinophila]OLS01686.1 glycerol-3-phosphate acyltransferase [Tissierella creatinophila DSM 6911]
MSYIFLIIISYLMGCFSSAYIVGKTFKKIDIRDFGSGNVGSTNALRVMGVKFGIFTFLLDILKGVLAVYIGKFILGDIGGVVAGLFVVIGHDWPVFIGFKGGKGVATSIGVLLVLFGVMIFIPLVITIIIISITKYVSLGSIAFLVMMPIVYSIFIREFKMEYFILSLMLALFGVIRHKENIKRLIKGKENKIKIGR